mgnify:CR=1 FL=1|jgi:hypothetical protein
MTERQAPFHKLYDRFGLLFLVTVVTMALLLLVDLDQDEGIAELLSFTVTLLAAATLFLAVAAAGVGYRGRQITLVLIGAVLVAAIVSMVFSDVPNGHGGLLWLILVTAAPIVALRRLVQHRTVKVETLLGALSVYLLIALAATYFFLFIDTFLSGSGRFFGQEEPTTVFTYFSLITITTVGYGDFDPAGVVGRAAAAWEAIIGQIYLVVVVARLVTLYGGGRLLWGSADSPPDD